MSSRIYKFLNKQIAPMGLQLRYVELIYDLFSQTCVSIDYKGYAKRSDLHNIISNIIVTVTQKFRIVYDSGYTNERDRVYLRFKMLSVPTHRQTDERKNVTSDMDTISSDSDVMIRDTASEISSMVFERSTNSTTSMKNNTEIKTHSDTDISVNSISSSNDSEQNEPKHIPVYEKIMNQSLAPKDTKGFGFSLEQNFVPETAPKTVVSHVHFKSDADLIELSKKTLPSDTNIVIDDHNIKSLKDELKVLKILIDSQKVKISALELENTCNKSKILEIKKIKVSDFDNEIKLRRRSILRESPKYEVTAQKLSDFEIWTNDQSELEAVLIELFAGLSATKWLHPVIQDIIYTISNLGFTSDYKENVQLLLATVGPVVNVMEICKARATNFNNLRRRDRHNHEFRLDFG